MSPLLTALSDSCGAGMMLVGLVLVITALAGKARATRPTCRSCRLALRATAELPQSCASCRADLTRPSAIRFTGHRIRWQPMLIGAMLLLGPPLAGAVVRWFWPPAPAFVAGRPITIPIERRPSAARFDEATANDDVGAWIWIHEHLLAGELSEGLRSEVARRAVEATRQGLGADALDQSIELLIDRIDERALVEATIDAAQAPTLTATRQRGGAVRIDVEWNNSNALNRHQHLPRQRVCGITAIRVNGRAVRPMRPTQRVAVVPWRLAVFVPRPEWIGARVTAEVEVDLVIGVLDELPDLIARWGIAGPPETWPDLLGRRTITLRAELPPMESRDVELEDAGQGAAGSRGAGAAGVP